MIATRVPTAIQVQTYTLDGVLERPATLAVDRHLDLWLDGDQVVATGMWGVKVALTTTRRIILVDRSAFEALTRRYSAAG
jgi:hypothetical protein